MKAIIEGNKVIDKFMPGDQKKWNRQAVLRYDLCWDFLMPVFFKIEELGYLWCIDSEGCEIEIRDNTKQPNHYKIINLNFDDEDQNQLIPAWKSVIEFINRHNAHKS